MNKVSQIVLLHIVDLEFPLFTGERVLFMTTIQKSHKFGDCRDLILTRKKISINIRKRIEESRDCVCKNLLLFRMIENKFTSHIIFLDFIFKEMQIKDVC